MNELNEISPLEKLLNVRFDTLTVALLYIHPLTCGHVVIHDLKALQSGTSATTCPMTHHITLQQI